ncbi:DUF4236 domain-containing protein [Alkalilacustris brevis]
MPFRFWHLIRLVSGFTLNLSNSTVLLSLGPRGAMCKKDPHGHWLTT